MADKPYRAKKRPGPKASFPGGKTISVLLGERERLMIAVWIKRQPHPRPDRSTVIRTAIHLLCKDITEEQIEVEKAL